MIVLAMALVIDIMKPASLGFVTPGMRVSLASTIIAESTLVAAPAIAVVAYRYSAWSTKWSLVMMIGITPSAFWQ
jgi:putative MFS transporter